MTRHTAILTLLKNVPHYRQKQIDMALFDAQNNNWENITVLPKELRTLLTQEIPWMTLDPKTTLESKYKNTFKSILQTHDNKRIESVLMQNARGHWTLCVSSQVGCAMNCSFCATGKMGFVRNLTSDEIVDQYRYWIYFLRKRNDLTSKNITNIVYMGMGEPLANYTNVKESLNQILTYTDIGPTRITVSTVGVLPQMQKLLSDPEWPNIRMAISLHSANPTTRRNIVPSTSTGFFDQLTEWMQNSHKLNSTRRHHITFEHILIEGINDNPEDAKKLVGFSQRAHVPIKINLIPYNETPGNPFSKSAVIRQIHFQEILMNSGITATIRKPMGDDIAAACGQLIAQNSQ